MTYPIEVALLPELAHPDRLQAAELAVVIDTLRFTTTACQALAAGARHVLAVQEVAEAFAIREAQPGDTLLCGERFCRPIEGFDLGNSPSEYTADVVAGKTLVFTTTNGTKAVVAAKGVARIALAALTNRAAVCQRIRDLPERSPVTIICAGTDGQVAMEDVMTAGAILAAGISGSQPRFEPTGDAARLALAAWQRVEQQSSDASGLASRIEAEFRTALGGANLVDSEYAGDLAFSANIDSNPCVGMSIASESTLAQNEGLRQIMERVRCFGP